MSLIRTIRTARHLRARQVVGQIDVRLRRMLGADAPPQPSQRAPQFPGVRWSPRAGILPPSPHRWSSDDLLCGKFTFLNREQTIGFPPAWDQPDLPKLWQYNLHYFEFLWSLDYVSAKRVVEDWITNHDGTAHAIGWQPYPTSLRLQNWCGFFFATFQQQTLADSGFLKSLWESVHRQAQWLTARLEFHLLGNHVLENAVTLCMLGSCFEGEQARQWHDTGVELLRTELAEQVLSDGGHFERSPMYQNRAIYTLATLLNVGSDDVRSVVHSPLHEMLDASGKLLLGDDKFALLNDAAYGIYPDSIALRQYAVTAGAINAATPRFGASSLSKSGYFGWRSAQGTSVLCDAAPVGPDYLPGHAHGDIFSFEYAHAGQRVIVDSGTFEYDPGEMRRYCRSTAAHNTVELDGQDQCEFWGAFRVARRGKPHDVRFEQFPDGFRLCGWHDGYMRLPGKPTHARRFRWHEPGILMIRDAINSLASHQIVSRLHLHPDCILHRKDERTVEVEHACGRVQILSTGGLLGAEDGWFCPEFGLRHRTQVLTLSTFGSRAVMGWCIIPLTGDCQFDLQQGLVLHGHTYVW